MDSPNTRRTPFPPALLVILLLVGATPCLAQEGRLASGAKDAPVGAGARVGIQGQSGEMVLLRDVATRPAYRPAPPGIALIANPSPTRELSNTLGTDDGFAELSDDDFAAMGSGNGAVGAVPQPGHTTTVERMTNGVVGSTLGRVAGSDGLLSGNNLSQSINGPVGAVGNTTRGIGDHVLGALSQFPMLGQPANAGGPGH
ncbi:MAG TPA: hypothetical protein VGC74_09765 [Stenotrophomonas sp.]|jgi:hypothetical protein